MVLSASVALGVDKEIHQLAENTLPADRVTQRNVALNVVPVAAAVLLLGDIARVYEVDHDAERRPLGDVEGDGDVPKT